MPLCTNIVFFHIFIFYRTSNVVSHSKNYSERVGEAINNIMEDTALMNKVMRSLMNARKVSNEIMVNDDEEDEDDEEMEEEILSENTSNLTEFDANTLLTEAPQSVDTITEAFSNQDEVKAEELTSFNCWECGRDFVYRNAFTKHMKSQHGIDYTAENTQPSKRKQRNCPVCSQTFWYSTPYEKHLREKHDMEPDVSFTEDINAAPTNKPRPRGRPRKHPEKPKSIRNVIHTATALMQGSSLPSKKSIGGSTVSIPLPVLILRKSGEVFRTLDRNQTETVMNDQLMCSQCQALFLEIRAFAVHMFTAHSQVVKDETLSTYDVERLHYYCHLCPKTSTTRLNHEHHLKYNHKMHVSNNLHFSLH